MGMENTALNGHKKPQGGVIAQRGFIFQTIIAIIECLERDDWDEVKMEPETSLDKIDIMLKYCGKRKSAIQVKSSNNRFEQYQVKKWLESLRRDAENCEEIQLCLISDKLSESCRKYIEKNSEVRFFLSTGIDECCRNKLREYVAEVGLDNNIDDEDLQVVYNNVFSEVHNNSIAEGPFSRNDLKLWLKRVLAIPKCLTPVPLVDRRVGIIGREKVLQEVHSMLDKDWNLVLVSGLGGIGKTAVMRWICNAIKEDGNTKNHVAWVICGDNLKDDLLTLKDVLGVATGEGKEADYRRVIYKLKKNVEGTLYLFLDNMSYMPDDDELADLNSLQPKVRVMITARHVIPDIPNKDLRELEFEPAIEMFYRYYGGDKAQKYRNTAEKIVETVFRHTLLIELLAKAAWKAGGTLEAFYLDLKEKGYFDIFNRPINTKHDKNKTIEESIVKLYTISVLSLAQQHIMKLFTIFSPEKEIYFKVGEWAGLNMNALDELVELAWLERGGIENGYCIHQIVKDSLSKQVGELKLEDYGSLLYHVIRTNEYLSVTETYIIVRERIVLAEDIADFLYNEMDLYLKTLQDDGKDKGWYDTTIGRIWKQKKKQHYSDEGRLTKTRVLFSNLAGVYKDQGNYAKAQKYYWEALVISELLAGENHIDTATAYHNMALVYQAQCEYEKALEYYLKALAISERVLGKAHPDTATTYHNLAAVYNNRGEFKKALEYYKKALVARERVLGKDHPSTAMTYNNMAVVYYDLADYSKALEYYRKALAVQERVLGEEHPDTAITYGNVALVYNNMGDYVNALKYNKKALAIQESVLGEDHPSTKITYNNLALLYEDLGDVQKALEYNQKALGIGEQMLGEEPPSTATMYNNLAERYVLQGEFQSALEYYRKALVVQKQMFGETHPDTAKIYNNLAEVYMLQGEFRKALEYFRKALAIQERVLGKAHPDTAMTYNNLGEIYSKQGEFQTALEYYRKALAIQELVLGEEHPNTVTIYNNIGRMHVSQGEYKQALEYYWKVNVILGRVLGMDHISTATAYSNLAWVFSKQGNYEKALKYYWKSFSISERLLGADNPDMFVIYHDLAQVYYAKGDYEKALEYFMKILAICKQVWGKNHQDLATTYNEMAEVFRAKGDYVKAIEYNENALAIRERVLGIDHPDTAITYNDLATNYVYQGKYEKAFDYYQKALKICRITLGEGHPTTKIVHDNLVILTGKMNQ